MTKTPNPEPIQDAISYDRDTNSWWIKMPLWIVRATLAMHLPKEEVERTLEEIKAR